MTLGFIQWFYSHAFNEAYVEGNFASRSDGGHGIVSQPSDPKVALQTAILNYNDFPPRMEVA